MDELTLWIAVVSIAVALQMPILFFLYLAVRSLTKRVETLVDDVQPRVLPLLEQGKAILQEVKTFVERARPKIEVVVDNAEHVTTKARADIERVSVTVNDVVDRTRLQAIRIDEMVTRTLDGVEETSEKVQQSVKAPVRRVSGIAQAIGVGVSTYFRNQRRGRNGGPDEMFI
jgi:hypothetical protein